MKQLLIEMQYLGSIDYYRKLQQYGDVIIERHENFVKSTYRNRCYISGPNGKLRLSIPLNKGKQQRSRYTEIKIDYDYDWQRIHWNSICSAYRRSPYFEFYEHRFERFYKENFEYLFDFNHELTELILELLGLDVNLEFSKAYQKSVPEDVIDYRSKIIPKGDLFKGDIPIPKYRQVFEDRVGFFENLSIVDLLFNEGPHSKEFLHVHLKST